MCCITINHLFQNSPSPLLKLGNNRKCLVSTHPSDTQTHTHLYRSGLKWKIIVMETDSQTLNCVFRWVGGNCSVYACLALSAVYAVRGTQKRQEVSFALLWLYSLQRRGETLLLIPLSLALSFSLCYLHLCKPNKKVLLDWTMRSYTHPSYN